MLLSYATLCKETITELKEKGSSFIAIAFPVQDTDAFLEKLSSIRKEYYDATHHCYAVRLAQGYEKYSDDGEPNGTAGVRIMNALISKELYDTAIIVVRYFGGVKLGVGPLGTAYTESALSALGENNKQKKDAYCSLSLIADFEQTSAVYHLFSQFTLRIIDTSYSERVSYSVHLLFAEKEKFLQRLDDAFRGKYECKVDEGVLYL